MEFYYTLLLRLCKKSRDKKLELSTPNLELTRTLYNGSIQQNLILIYNSNPVGMGSVKSHPILFNTLYEPLSLFVFIRQFSP